MIHLRGGSDTIPRRAPWGSQGIARDPKGRGRQSRSHDDTSLTQHIWQVGPGGERHHFFNISFIKQVESYGIHGDSTIFSHLQPSSTEILRFRMEDFAIGLFKSPLFGWSNPTGVGLLSLDLVEEYGGFPKLGGTPDPFYNRIFHCKLTILGIPHGGNPHVPI